MILRWRSVAVVAPLIVGVALLALTLVRIELTSELVRTVALVLPVALVPSAAWHVLRTIAWRQCFPEGTAPSFARTFRVRLAAEAFSFVTIRGVAGEPLKIVLLGREVDPAVSTAAVALERVAYILVTTLIVGLAALVAIFTLPLSRAWTNVFAGFAAATVLIALLSAMLLSRRGASSPDRSLPSGENPGPFRRFIRQLDAQLHEVMRGDRRRLVSLVALEACAYLTMALEVWAVLQLTPAPITLGGAMAVETFTRVASMLSAFIPANLGALEASNVAAATAVHAAGGAAALALARRFRGIVWCAAGFLVYPRPRTRLRRAAAGLTADRARGDAARDKTSDEERVLVVLENPRPGVRITDRLGGLPIGERVVRAAARAGFTSVLVWTPDQHAEWRAAAKRLRGSLDLAIESGRDQWQLHVEKLHSHAAVVIVAPEVVPSPALLESACELAPDEGGPVIAATAGHVSETGVFRALPRSIADPAALARDLGRRSCQHLPADETADGRGFASLYVPTLKALAAAERAIRLSIFKPTDGVLGRFNRRISIPISIALIHRMRLSAHVMSALIIVLGLYAGWLFSRGDYVDGVLAAVVSWAASVLDGCDGELARLQYSDSAFGCWLDTIGDYMYYIAIFVGLTIGAVRQTGWAGFWWVGAALLIGSLLTIALLILLRARITNGRPEQLRSTTKAHFYASGKRWARVVARISTVATRATMPYGILAFASVYLLPGVLVLAAIGAQIYWISLAVERRRLLKKSAAFVAESAEPVF